MLIGTKISLQEYESNADIIRLCSWTKDEEVLLNFAPSLKNPVNFETMKRRIEQVKRINHNSYIFKIVDTNNSQHIGHAEIARINFDFHSASICHLLIEDKYRNTGYGTDLVHTLLRYLFTKLQIHRVELNVIPNNHSAIHCYMNCGFQKEGLKRDVIYFNQKYYDSIIMSVLINEWKPIYYLYEQKSRSIYNEKIKISANNGLDNHYWKL